VKSKKWSVRFDEKAQTLWLLSFISIHRPPVRQRTTRRAPRWTEESEIIAVCRLPRDGTEASSAVYPGLPPAASAGSLVRAHPHASVPALALG
jgi:hypothetical protein